MPKFIAGFFFYLFVIARVANAETQVYCPPSLPTTPIPECAAEPMCVKNYGAVGDGVTDDSVAISRAWDAIWSDYFITQSGRPAYSHTAQTLYFPPGNYVFNGYVGCGTNRQSNPPLGLDFRKPDESAINQQCTKSGEGYPGSSLPISIRGASSGGKSTIILPAGDDQTSVYFVDISYRANGDYQRDRDLWK